jgi:hypothetical protein
LDDWEWPMLVYCFLKGAERYTHSADQLRLAKAAMHMLETLEQNGTEPCPAEVSGGTLSAKR